MRQLKSMMFFRLQLEGPVTHSLFFSFSHATAPRCDPIVPDPSVSEEWGQQQHYGVNMFSHVFVWTIRKVQ